MNPREIAQSYDQIADRWHSDSFPRRNGIAQHERAIAFLREKRFALDVGCGSSGRIIDQLLHQGFAVEGAARNLRGAARDAAYAAGQAAVVAHVVVKKAMFL